MVLMSTHNRPSMLLRSISSLRDSIGKKRILISLTNSGKDVSIPSLPNLETRTSRADPESFWAESMYKSSEILLGTSSPSTVMWLNEDVILFPNSVETLLKVMEDNNADIVIGQTCSKDSEISYGGYKRRSNFLPLHFERILATTQPIVADTFNGNIVLISPQAVRTLGSFLPGYKHTLADIAYGLEATRKGLKALVAPGFSGICEPNTTVNSSLDVSSPRRSRIQALNKPHGIPIAQQLKFSIRYGGVLGVLYVFSTYLRFLLTLIQYKKQVNL